MRQVFNETAFETHFANIGLVTNEMPKVSALDKSSLYYFNESYVASALSKPSNIDLKYRYDRVAFTQTGRELRRVVSAKPIPGYIDSLSEYLSNEFSIVLTPLE